MNKAIKAQWISALRSGEYTQGYGALNIGNTKFCCLGVLCDLHKKDNRINPKSGYCDWIKLHESNKLSYLDRTEELPASVYKWAQLQESIPAVHYNGKPIILSVLNDQLRLSFQEIADLIEINF